MIRLLVAAGVGMVLSLSVLEAADPIGTWRWEHEDLQGRGTVKDAVTFRREKDGLTGTYEGIDGKYELKSVKVDGDQLTWDFDVEVDGDTINIAFDGKISGDDVKGKVVLGEFGEFPWAAKRDPAKPTDPVGIWRWEHEDLQGRGTVKDMVTFRREEDGLTGTYEGVDGKFELKSVEVDGDQLAWEFDVEVDGDTINVAFSGKISGDDVKGSVVLGQFGEYPWEAKRDATPAPAPPGTWNLSINMPDGSVSDAVLKIEQNKKGNRTTYTTNGQDFTIDDLKVSEEGAFTFTLNVEDFGLVAKFSGQADETSAKGTIDYDLNGDTGQTDFTGEKAE